MRFGEPGRARRHREGDSLRKARSEQGNDHRECRCADVSCGRAGALFSGSSGINVGQTEEAEDLYLYADAPHTQIFRPNRRGYNARANDLNLPILWLDF